MTVHHNTRVLILVKTYPQPSRKYEEIVCTAGVTDALEWVRLYPIDFRDLPPEKQFQKYEWIDVNLAPRGQAADNRRESRRPNVDSIVRRGTIGTADGWAARREIVSKLPVHTIKEYEKLYEEERVSLGIVRPERVLDVKIEKDDVEWPADKLDLMNQLRLFGPERTMLRRIPFKFRYVFKCHDSNDTYTRLIEDWELGALYLNEERRLGSAEKAAASVRSKYLDDFFGPGKESLLFVGTTFPWNTWVVIGVFYPPRKDQLVLQF